MAKLFIRAKSLSSENETPYPLKHLIPKGSLHEEAVMPKA